MILHPTIRDIPMPRRIAMLPLTENGYPILFFADINPDTGKPDLRLMDGRKLMRCIKERLCWLCGQPMGKHKAFVIGPMCAVTRTTSEPPCHLECALYAVKVCPFLTRPRAHRRAHDIPEDATVAGYGLDRNPGVAAVWVTDRFKTFRPHTGGQGILIEIGDPSAVTWWCEGRPATYGEVVESIQSSAPELLKMCDLDDDQEGARRELSKSFAKFLPLLGNLPGREDGKTERFAKAGVSEQALLTARADERAWFVTHPDEDEYVRPIIPGELPHDPRVTHVRVAKMDVTGRGRSREFGMLGPDGFVEVV